MTIRQLLVGAAAGDAITAMADEIDRALGTRSGGIFALHRDASAFDRTAPLAQLPPGRRHDVLVYHASFGDPRITSVLLNRPDRLVLVYHNLTPSKFFLDVEPAFAAGLQWGRHELTQLRGRTVLNVADSAYNAAELAAMGFDDVVVVPAGVRPHRLLDVVPDLGFARRLPDVVPVPFVLSVSQVLPHKRHDSVLAAVHLLQWVHGRDVGLVVVGAHRIPKYATALVRQARAWRTRNVWFTGPLDDSALAVLYRRASVYVNASEHEGLGLPPLEAMAFGLPVIVRDAGALRDTVGDGALVVPAAAGPATFATAIERVLDDAPLRATLTTRGLARAAEAASTDATRTTFLPLLEQLVA